jgi:hypothetical protein
MTDAMGDGVEANHTGATVLRLTAFVVTSDLR